MLFGLFCWSISAIFILLITTFGYRLLRTNKTAMNLVCFLFLGIFFTTIFQLSMGLLGRLAPEPILIVSVVGITALALIPDSRTAIIESGKEGVNFLRRCSVIWSSLPRWLRFLTIVFIFASGVRFTFLIWALPPFVWDSLTYHLVNVAEWTRHARIFIVDAAVPRVALPSNYETFATWFTVFLHHDVVVEAAGLPAYFLIFAASFAIARKIKLKYQAAWIAALSYCSTPALVLVVTGTKNDPFMTGIFLSAIAIILDITQREDQSKARNLPGQVVLLAIILLYAVGTKAYILNLLPGLFAIAILGMIQSNRKRKWFAFIREIWHQIRIISASQLRWLTLLLIAGLFIGGFWNLRNWVLFGNPFYPFSLRIQNENVFQGVEGFLPVGLERLPRNLVNFAGKFGDGNFKIIPALAETTGWGWFAYILGLPGLIWGFIKSSKIRILTFTFVLTFLILFMAINPGPYNMRYQVYFPALFALGFAVFYEWMPKSYRLERFIFITLIYFTLGMNLVLTINYNRVSVDEFGHILSVPVLERDAARLRVYVPQEYEDALEVVSNDEILGYNVGIDALIYPLYRADYSQVLAYVPIDVDESCESIALKMHTRNTKWLFTAVIKRESKRGSF
ncbi:MAG: hypothetical protein P8Z34_14330 [Anaerolineales bacterium]